MMALVTEAPFTLQSEVETISNVCFRALDGSNYDVRCHIAQLLAFLFAECLKSKHVPGKQLMPDWLTECKASVMIGPFHSTCSQLDTLELAGGFGFRVTIKEISPRFKLKISRSFS